MPVRGHFSSVNCIEFKSIFLLGVLSFLSSQLQELHWQAKSAKLAWSFSSHVKNELEQFTYVRKNWPTRSSICCRNLTCQCQSREKRKGHKRGGARSCRHLSLYLQVRKTELMFKHKGEWYWLTKIQGRQTSGNGGIQGFKHIMFSSLGSAFCIDWLYSWTDFLACSKWPRGPFRLVLVFSAARGVFWSH